MFLGEFGTDGTLGGLSGGGSLLVGGLGDRLGTLLGGGGDTGDLSTDLLGGGGGLSLLLLVLVEAADLKLLVLLLVEVHLASDALFFNEEGTDDTVADLFGREDTTVGAGDGLGVGGGSAGVEVVQSLSTGEALVAEDPRGVGALRALADLLEDEAVTRGTDLANLVATGGVVHTANVRDTRAAHFFLKVCFFGGFFFQIVFLNFFLKEKKDEEQNDNTVLMILNYFFQLMN